MTPQTSTAVESKTTPQDPAVFHKNKTMHDVFNRPLHDLRISVIDRCNFRCNYCMPSEEYHESYTFLNHDEWLTFDEIARLAQIFSQLGVSKIRITGGEPLLRPGLAQLIARLSVIHRIDDLALTTNGFYLAREAKALKNAGLKRITISLDTLDDKIFQSMNGHKGTINQVLEGLAAAEQAGLAPVKINAVIQKGFNDQTVLDLIRRFKSSGHIIRFIEYMDVGNRNHWKPELVVASQEIAELINKEFPLRALSANYPGEVAERYEFIDGTGEIGFISSITQPFCGSCSRARLSTDGKLYLCLFAGNGVDLRKPLRDGASDDEIANLITHTWQNRQDRYSEERFAKTSTAGHSKKVEMYQIGG